MASRDLQHSKVFLLDHDGVLNPDAAYMHEGKPVPRVPWQQLMWVPELVDLLSRNDDLRVVLPVGFATCVSHVPSHVGLGLCKRETSAQLGPQVRNVQMTVDASSVQLSGIRLPGSSRSSVMWSEPV